MPEPGARPAGRDLPGPGPSRLHLARAAGLARRTDLGNCRLLRGRVLRGEPRAAVRIQVWLRRRAEWLLPAVGQPAERPAQAGKPVRREQAAAAAEHPDPGAAESAGRRPDPAVLDRIGQWQPD